MSTIRIDLTSLRGEMQWVKWMLATTITLQLITISALIGLAVRFIK